MSIKSGRHFSVAILIGAMVWCGNVIAESGHSDSGIRMHVSDPRSKSSYVLVHRQFNSIGPSIQDRVFRPVDHSKVKGLPIDFQISGINLSSDQEARLKTELMKNVSEKTRQKGLSLEEVVFLGLESQAVIRNMDFSQLGEGEETLKKQIFDPNRKEAIRLGKYIFLPMNSLKKVPVMSLAHHSINVDLALKDYERYLKNGDPNSRGVSELWRFKELGFPEKILKEKYATASFENLNRKAFLLKQKELRNGNALDAIRSDLMDYRSPDHD